MLRSLHCSGMQDCGVEVASSDGQFVFGSMEIVLAALVPRDGHLSIRYGKSSIPAVTRSWACRNLARGELKFF